MPQSIIAKTPPIESAAKEGASAEKTPIGGASQEPLSPGNLKEPELREAVVRAAPGSGHTGEREFLFFICFWRKCFSQTESKMPAK